MKKLLVKEQWIEIDQNKRVKLKNLKCPYCNRSWVYIMFTDVVLSWDIHEGIDYIRFDADTFHDAWVTCNFCEKEWRLEYEFIEGK